jgi:hypothetical protein
MLQTECWGELCSCDTNISDESIDAFDRLSSSVPLLMYDPEAIREANTDIEVQGYSPDVELRTGSLLYSQLKPPYIAISSDYASFQSLALQERRHKVRCRGCGVRASGASTSNFKPCAHCLVIRMPINLSYRCPHNKSAPNHF